MSAGNDELHGAQSGATQPQSAWPGADDRSQDGSGWAAAAGPAGTGYAPAPPARPGHHRHRRALALTAAAGLAAGALGGVWVEHANSTSAGSAATTSTAVLSTAQIAAKTDPGLVDVVSTLGYQSAESAGTGIVLTSSGEVLTNNHVINGATSIRVTDIGNGRTYQARVVGYDSSDDVAVLKLQGASGLKTAALGSSSSVTVGQKVVAIGNAGGKGGSPSVVTGRVTGLGQSITAEDDTASSAEHLTGLIETNAPIQPGDSGGSLVNSFGQVIGIDTAASTASEPDAAAGATSATTTATQAFAIPISKAVSIARQIETGTASSAVHIGATGLLGVEVESAQSGFGGFSGGAGVTVAGVAAGSPAATAGLQAGDVITAVAGTAVTSPSGIQAALGAYHPGSEISVSWTDQSGQSQSATVTLATGPAV